MLLIQDMEKEITSSSNSMIKNLSGMFANEIWELMVLIRKQIEKIHKKLHKKIQLLKEDTKYLFPSFIVDEWRQTFK